MKRHAITLLLIAMTATPALAVETLEGPGSAQSNVTVKTKIGSACIMSVNGPVNLTPTLYWTSTTDATGTAQVNVRCNEGTQFKLSAPPSATLQNGEASIKADITGGTNGIVTASTSNGASTTTGQTYNFNVTVAATQLSASNPVGAYGGTATVTLELVGPAEPTDDNCELFGPIVTPLSRTAQ
ncbi:hypothetical protein [Deinococcus pimensis]|uniref:hypothetical protein n=1 Tax=Deinococcus pimensis TaxID=309888 RepID=UPI000486D317|nr:hypothetical protein [Deinococcus pimensis]